MISQLKNDLVFDNELYLSVYQYSPLLIEKIINASQIKKINLLFHFEYDIPLDYKIINLINKKKIECHIITCANDINYIKKRAIELGFNNKFFIVDNFPTYFFNNAYDKIPKHNLEFSANRNFDYCFLSYNGHTKPHRSQFIDCLYHLNLLDKGIVSYLQLGGLETNWHYYNGNRIEHDVQFDDTNGHDLNNCIINKEYLESFLHIVTESCLETTVITEKTTKPLLLGLPFLVLGSQFFHSDLQQLGFKLYDEIFDYSFDKHESIEQRILGVIKNIQFALKNKKKLNYYYKKIYPKILHNQKLAIEFATSWKYYPKEFQNSVEKLLLKEYIHNNEFQELIYINENIKDYKLFDLTKFRTYDTKDVEEIYL